MTKEGILDEVFNMVYLGQFSFSEVWQMPVRYKRYLLSKLIEIKEKEKQEIDNAMSRVKSKRK